MGNNMFKFVFQLALLLVCSLYQPLSHALCGMDEDDDYYGNAETCPFKNAIESTEGLTPDDVAFLNAVNATRIINRWYMRLMAGKPKFQVRDIQNTSVGTFNGLSVATPAFSESHLQVTLAGGYFWEQWAAEFEILFSKRFDFTLAPTFANPPALPGVSTQIQFNQVAAFFNMQYVIPRLFSWYPRRLQIHLDGGIGGALKQNNVTITSLTGISYTSATTRNVTAAANLGVGTRYQVTAHVLVDIAYRYFFLGKTKFGPAFAASPLQDVQFQSKELQTNGFFAGAVYQF